MNTQIEQEEDMQDDIVYPVTPRPGENDAFEEPNLSQFFPPQQQVPQTQNTNPFAGANTDIDESFDFTLNILY
ncbi:MAG: hypothetical protein EZS28_012932 [Streblomastix strix]|uniref:Uncharacterized protein n=1 Tax=Streblomastix strix TaxID=222440 RepID=A0A5J4WAY8_9EUKA|nr:MAG: hypothetical protein EZS28_012932 [Streblomastix strix]